MATYKRHDAYYHKAKRENFAARSVYKLEEVDERFQLFGKGHRVVDLGCAPGSWLQYLIGVLGDRGLVVGYDLAVAKVSAPNLVTHVVDVFTLTPEQIRADAYAALHPGEAAPAELTMRFDGLVSDLAPKTTGIRDADQAKSVGLVEHALGLARALVRPEGYFVAKVFQGRGFDELILEVRRAFTDVRVLKPKATRQGSREGFIVAKGLREL